MAHRDELRAAKLERHRREDKLADLESGAAQRDERTSAVMALRAVGVLATVGQVGLLAGCASLPTAPRTLPPCQASGPDSANTPARATLAPAPTHQPPRPRAGAPAQPTAPSTTQPLVYVLPTVHSYHLSKRVGYSLLDLAHQIEAIRPDIVCAEIDPSDYRTKLEGAFYPIENAMVEYGAKAAGAVFWPSDWRIGYQNDHLVESAVEAMTDAEKRRYQGAFDAFMPRFKASFGNGVFDFYASATAQRAVRQAHQAMITAGGDPAAGFWTARNQMIVKRCMRKAQLLGAKTVVFTFGGDHKYAIEDALRQLEAVEAQPVVRRFAHSEAEVPPEVVTHWQRNLDGLRATIANHDSPPALVRAIESANMVERLSQAIEQRGAPK